MSFLLLAALLLAACADGETVRTAPQPTITLAPFPTVPPGTPSTTTAPEPEPEPTVRAFLQRLDPETLEPVGSRLEVVGHLTSESSALPDGRLVFTTWVGEGESNLVVFDPVDGVVETVPLPVFVTPVGYSSALGLVVLLGYRDESPGLYLFDPGSATIEAVPLFDDHSFGWPIHAALFDEGRKIAFYSAHVFAEDRIGDTPLVVVGDLEARVLGEPIPIPGVMHGYTELPPDLVRDPGFPYGEVEPGIVFDQVGNRLFAVHADGGRCHQRRPRDHPNQCALLRCANVLEQPS